jgi:hypothetical protein
MREEPMWHHEVQIILRARHRNVEQTPLFLDLVGHAGPEIGRDAAIDHVEHEDGSPLLALGRMDRR